MTETQVVIVTGAGGNLGRALCGLLAQRGWQVVAVGRDAAADLADPAQAEAVVAQAGARIDALAHTVGGFAMAKLAESGPALWERMLRANLLSTANVFRAVWPRMQAAGRGSLVAVSAGAALRTGAGIAAYGAAKAGVLRLVESAAEEGKAIGIRANAVLPSIIDTPQNRAAMPGADTSKWVTPLQVAEVIAFLLSEAASGITGAAIPVSGRG